MMVEFRDRLTAWIVMLVCTGAACQAQTSKAPALSGGKPKIADPGGDAAAVSATVLELAGEGGVKFDPSVPTPADALGFEMGSRPIRHLELKLYLRRLAEASDRVEFREYAKSHEGRDLFYVVISDPAHMVRLDDIRKGLAKLADPRKTTDTEAAEIIDKSPAVAWMLYTVHGDEMSGTDAAVVAAYRLAAGRDARTLSLLKDVVVCIDPLQNPDGRERFLSMLQQGRGKVPTGDVQSVEHRTPWPWGRTNHYLFDLNRDWNVTIQPESQGRVKAIADWHPQLVVDGHEMGPTETYLFSPPTEPFNLHIPTRILDWFEKYTTDQADAFDRHGWSYYRGEWNEAWAIGFADVWSMHHGAAGILYEQARSAGTLVRLPTGQDRFFREDVAHQLVSTMANLRTLAANRKQFLADFYADKKASVADTRAIDDRNLFLFVPDRNRTRAAEFFDLLARQNIESYVVGDGGVTVANAVDVWGAVEEKRAFPAGTIVIQTKQPLSPLLRGMLEFDPKLTDAFLAIERRELELKSETKLYDVTGWCIAMGYDVEAYWARGDLNALMPSLRPAAHDAITGTRAGAMDVSRAYGFLMNGDDDAAIALAGRMLQSGWHIRAAKKPFTSSGHSFPSGSFLIRGHENAERMSDIRHAIADLPDGVGVVATTARSSDGPDLGGGEFPLLTEPRIALIGNVPISANSYGAIWHLLDARAGLRISRLQAHALSSYDLRKYNVIILPDASDDESLTNVLNEGIRDQLDTWTREGGTLIAIGGTAATLAREEGLGSARLRRDVLKDIDIYAEAVWRERAAATPSVDADQVWEFDREKGFSTTRPSIQRIKTEDVDALQRHDAWARRFMPHGVVLRVDLLPEHWLGHGMRGRVPVMYGLEHALMSKPPVETAARLAEAESLRMSGLLWPEARERLADAAYLTREPADRGQLILFATDPTFRGFFRGTDRLLLNAVVFGPGLGASVPLPW